VVQKWPNGVFSQSAIRAYKFYTILQYFLSDNFYDLGVESEYSHRWNGTVEQIYGKLSGRKNIQNLDFYQVLGNHDHHGNATAQVTYSWNQGLYKMFCHFYIKGHGRSREACDLLYNLYKSTDFYQTYSSSLLPHIGFVCKKKMIKVFIFYTQQLYVFFSLETTWALPWFWYSKIITKNDLSIRLIFIDTEIISSPVEGHSWGYFFTPKFLHFFFTKFFNFHPPNFLIFINFLLHQKLV